MHKLLIDSPGEKMLLMGNEAVARGALEAGLAFATCYPGTPSSEIPEQFFNISRESDLYFEYSTNEKVAIEVASGAAIPGLRTIVTMKHVGVNVAADPLMSLAYTGVKGGMVIVTADDPSMFSSQNEQDNRYYSRISFLPMLEPTNAQEMKDWTALAFEISEELEIPVILRITTRLAHLRGPVTLGKMRPIKSKTRFHKDPFRYNLLPAVSRRLHGELIEKTSRARHMAEKSPLNDISGSGEFGIISNGVSFNYVKDAVADLGIEEKTSLLKIGFSYPFPRELGAGFMRDHKNILVVEELEPLIEKELRAIAHEDEINVVIRGKGFAGLTQLYEYNPRMVREAVSRFCGVEYKSPDPFDTEGFPELPLRPPTLCAGCPHRATYYAIGQVYPEDAIHATDIGCYALGVMPPLSIGDMHICMGSSVSSACGFSKATDHKVAAFIGDSTFFHSGITGLVNAVHNNHKFTLVILDNGTTAMTGNQPHPGVDAKAMNIDRTQISIEAIVRACGVKDVHLVKPFNTKKTKEAVKASMEYDGMSVIISEEICPLYAKSIGKSRKARPFYIDRSKCKNHRECLNLLACPAMYLKEEYVEINKNLCIGCTVCAQICPENAIKPLKS
jgi:indolepyruvate ferredoxin oxidoreductase alpha subunit